ncbi:uncharacterized protein LOC135839092 [Planococcus citri]|uniref:uncharacterized protein LOC135839092 n=1 Tax=Planococcus citri TaxID=170843 RepID=UPI0031F943FC
MCYEKLYIPTYSLCYISCLDWFLNMIESAPKSMLDVFMNSSDDEEDDHDQIYHLRKSMLVVCMLVMMMMAILITLPHIDDFIYEMLVGEYEDESDDENEHRQPQH